MLKSHSFTPNSAFRQIPPFTSDPTASTQVPCCSKSYNFAINPALPKPHSFTPSLTLAKSFSFIPNLSVASQLLQGPSPTASLQILGCPNPSFTLNPAVCPKFPVTPNPVSSQIPQLCPKSLFAINLPVSPQFPHFHSSPCRILQLLLPSWSVMPRLLYTRCWRAAMPARRSRHHCGCCPAPAALFLGASHQKSTECPRRFPERIGSPG